MLLKRQSLQSFSQLLKLSQIEAIQISFFIDVLVTNYFYLKCFNVEVKIYL